MDDWGDDNEECNPQTNWKCWVYINTKKVNLLRNIYNYKQQKHVNCHKISYLQEFEPW
jgi:hypothetical protein